MRVVTVSDILYGTYVYYNVHLIEKLDRKRC